MVQGAEAHQVDGCLEHRHPVQGRVAGEAEGHAFVAAHRVRLEAGAVQVIGAALAGEHRLAASIPANKDAVVVQAVLIEQAGVDEAPDDLGGDAPLLKIGEHPPLVPVGDGQGEGRLFLLLGGFGARGGGVPGTLAVELQQVVHRLPEVLAAELLQKRNGVPALAVGVALPGAPILDAQAVHFPGGVVPAAQAADGVAQMLQQVRQIGPLGGLHLLVREAKGCILFCDVAHLLFRRNEKKPPEHP